MELERLLNSLPHAQRKIAGARRQKKKRVAKKSTRKTRINLAEHALKYELIQELAKASSGLTFGKLL